jgi:hypothetical protein
MRSRRGEIDLLDYFDGGVDKQSLGEFDDSCISKVIVCQTDGRKIEWKRLT